jgi:hypothetical protein
MPVRKAITEKDGVYFITITCARWLPLFKLTDGYDIVYNWFNYLKQNHHYIISYLIMPDHLHALIAFRNGEKSVNTIVGNGKRFMAYEIINRLKQQGKTAMLQQMKEWANHTDKQRNKQHEIFESSFDWKECRTNKFIEQKINYVHFNPCKSKPKLAMNPEEYMHSSAGFYINNTQGVYEVMSFMELEDMDLTLRCLSRRVMLGTRQGVDTLRGRKQEMQLLHEYFLNR